MRGSTGRLTAEEVREIRAAYGAAKPLRKRWRKPLAVKLGMAPSSLSSIARGERYAGVR